MGDEEPVLQTKYPKTVYIRHMRCDGCECGKVSYQLTDTTPSSINKDKDGGLKKNILQPRDHTSTDHFVSSINGGSFYTAGKKGDHMKFSGRTIFVKNSCGFIGLNNHVLLGEFETIQGSRNYKIDR